MSKLATYNERSFYQALATGTAKMAKNIMLIHQIEAELETELEKDKNRPKPTSKIGK